MSNLGYERIEADLYKTPSWMVDPIVDLLRQKPPGTPTIWECAAGEGNISSVLEKNNFGVISTDLEQRGYPLSERKDFLSYTKDDMPDVHGIVTNPPYGPGGRLAKKFLVHSLELMKPYGFVFMLLKADYDLGKTRRKQFGECPVYEGQLNFSKRPRWIEGTTGAPRHWYSWFFWDWQKQANERPYSLYDYESGKNVK